MSILLTNIHKWFNKRPVITNVSLEVKDNELFVLLGGSGSGKSTLLRIIAGLIPADSGQINIDGRDVTHLAPQARNIGFVFQNYSVFRHMTVSENIEFGLMIRQIPPAERRKRSAELLDLVNLTGLGARYTNQLSGGQQQRVALARALSYNPGVLLLDEPFGALDVKIRAQLRKSLKEIQRQLKVTMVLVTHDQEEAFELADRIGVVDYGHLLEVGSSETLYHHPQKEFTATFIGGGNVLVGRKEGSQIKVGAINLPLPKNAPAHDEKVPVRVLFRPEMVVLQEAPFASGQDVHVLGKGIVKELIFSGSLQRIFLEVTELQGLQPLVPQPVYGQLATQIIAVKPSTADSLTHFKSGQSLWIGLRDYHILESSGLKIMVYTDESPSGIAAAEYGLLLGSATGGSVTLLAVTGSLRQVADARDRLEKLGQDASHKLVNLTTKVKHGNIADEIINESFQEHYEVCVVNRAAEDMKLTSSSVWNRLINSGVPVLLIQDNHHQILQILICSAAGEPGKDDILFGGRVAKLTGAHITLFHIARKEATTGEKKRVEKHLNLGKASLEAMGIVNKIKIKEHQLPVEGIINEMESGNYDLLVIGAPAPKATQTFIWSNLTVQIISRTSRPVLVVPMLHE